MGYFSPSSIFLSPHSTATLPHRVWKLHFMVKIFILFWSACDFVTCMFPVCLNIGTSFPLSFFACGACGLGGGGDVTPGCVNRTQGSIPLLPSVGRAASTLLLAARQGANGARVHPSDLRGKFSPQVRHEPFPLEKDRFEL